VRYERPSTMKQASTLLAKEKGSAFILAGGTDLLVRLRTGFIEPDLVVDIKKIPSTRAIQSAAGGFKIGAAVTGAELGEHAKLKKAWPGVVEAANLIGSKQVQGRCTMTGNLCNASPAADSVPPVIAARTVAVVAGPNGRREVPVENIVTGPGRTSLDKGEFVVEFKIPKPKSRQCDAYQRFIPRTEMDIAVVGVAVNVTLNADGTCADARVVLGAVAPTQLVVEDAAKALIGHKLDENTLKALDAAAQAACKPITDKRGTIEYRTKVAGVLARRAAAIAFERAAARA